ncbi:MAG: DUF4177 domain-containing protein [Defluviitaleaceae bacterium]|nr:DUF4177 domain-containing protein [Defluviitaleaceae bacterium]MCL2263124.1 DUF4177 domain-containing protein [Defluviitaleaceae bacterium]
MVKWEYKYLEFYMTQVKGAVIHDLESGENEVVGTFKEYGPGLVKELNKYGADGWELIGAFPGAAEHVFEYIFKRPL